MCAHTRGRDSVFYMDVLLRLSVRKHTNIENINNVMSLPFPKMP